ncbi:MAG: hypothetical protein IJD91_08315 [Clostridia bacterium]|nr:hypothetical protein [Clostridia bacterium]
MDLCKEILVSALAKEEIQISFPHFDTDVEKLFEKECFKIIRRIKDILNDDSLEDKECFERIERLVIEFENLNCADLSRHDFG